MPQEAKNVFMAIERLSHIGDHLTRVMGYTGGADETDLAAVRIHNDQVIHDVILVSQALVSTMQQLYGPNAQDDSDLSHSQAVAVLDAMYKWSNTFESAQPGHELNVLFMAALRVASPDLPGQMEVAPWLDPDKLSEVNVTARKAVGRVFMMLGRALTSCESKPELLEETAEAPITEPALPPEEPPDVTTPLPDDGEEEEIDAT